METTRQSKISRLIQKDLSDIFQNETRKTHGTLISVSVVRVSPDLSVAKAYLSIFPPEKSQEILNKTVTENFYQISRLTKRLAYANISTSG